MSKKELTKRCLVFGLGLLISSFGVAFITKAALGTSPISSIPYTLSLGFKPTLGDFTLYMSIILIILQMILLRKKFPKIYWLQIPVSILFSFFIDLSMNMLGFMDNSSYWISFIYLILGCFILGSGIYLEVVANVVMLPGESFVNAVSITFNKEFGKTKMAFDVSMTIIATILGLIMFQKLAGVREGTFIASILVGATARFLMRKVHFIEPFFEDKKRTVDGFSNSRIKDNIVITIGREYGSGGREIASKLAESLGFEYYDKNIITMAVAESHLSEKYIEVKEQTMANSLLYDLFSQYKAVNEKETELDKLYEVESKIIKEAAEKGNCVIVGRCADHILRDATHCYKVFISAKDDYKVTQIMKKEKLDKATATKHMLEINKKRFKHYRYYTGKVWGLSKNYNLCLDVSTLSVDAVVTLIKSYIQLENNTSI